MRPLLQRVLTIICIVAVLLTIVYPLPVNATTVASGVWDEEQNITWSLNDKGVFSFSGNGKLGRVFDFKSSKWWSFDDVKEIVVNEGINTIDISALYYYFDADYITIPRSVKKIINTYSRFFCIKGYSGSIAEEKATKDGLIFYDISKKSYKFPKPQAEWSESYDSGGIDDSYNLIRIDLYGGKLFQNECGYEIYRKTKKSNKYRKIKNFILKSVEPGHQDCTSFVDRNLKFNQTYYYKIRYYITKDRKKYYSNPVYVTTKTKLAWTWIRGASTVKKGIRANCIKWEKVEGANGYKVYQYDYKKKKYVCVKDRKAKEKRNYIQTNVKNGRTYKYYVKAYRYWKDKKIYGHRSYIIYIKNGKVWYE